MLSNLCYRLALDIGTQSIGWTMLRLSRPQTADEKPVPVVIIKMGVRIFSDGRNPKDGSSLAVTRREARQMRRRRDRLLRRKASLMNALIEEGFFPADEQARRQLVRLDPYLLRKKGLDESLTPAEFARVLFHINQRRGFKSNRKTDKKDNESGVLKKAVQSVREQLQQTNARTVGEWLANRHERREGVRARLRGKLVKDKAYDLYIDRTMVERELDALWNRQAALNPSMFTKERGEKFRNILLYQRPLKPVDPGRCTLLPEESRAPLALMLSQRFRIYQEINHLRIINDQLQGIELTLEQRDELVFLLEKKDLSFTAIIKALNLPGNIQFNLDDGKRDKLKGNETSKVLSKKELFGNFWFELTDGQQEAVVHHLLFEENETILVRWLQETFGCEEPAAKRIANVRLPEGYGKLSAKALERVVPQLKKAVITYDKAVANADFSSHSQLSHATQTGEIMSQLPYYGKALERHVGLGSGKVEDSDEKRYGRIANPTVHIGLNELRKIVNALIERYGLPAEIVVEVARDLKNGKDRRNEIQKEQRTRQDENDRWRKEIRPLIGGAKPSRDDLQRMRLWVELNPTDPMNRRCPYTGELISIEMLFSDAVEIEHILPFARTLDDSLNNKTVVLRRANRDKANKTPDEAFGHSPAGYSYAEILQRAAFMPKKKAARFAPKAYETWLREDKDFLARALNDTAYLSRIAHEYVTLICPPDKVWVVTGKLTAMLRGKFGLNQFLSGSERKNRNDHRHHAIDAAVIGVTDRSLLARFARANAQTREKGLQRLIEGQFDPWPTFREQVKNSVEHIKVSFRPNHGYQGEIFDSTVYGLVDAEHVTYRREVEGEYIRAPLKRDVVRFAEPKAKNQYGSRHGVDHNNEPKPYMGLWARSNYCMEVILTESGEWRHEIIPRYKAYQIVNNKKENEKLLRHQSLSLSGNPLVFRLMIDDILRIKYEGEYRFFRITKLSEGGCTCTDLHEANVSNRYIARLADKKANKTGDAVDKDVLNDNFVLTQFSAKALQMGQAQKVTISPIGLVTIHRSRK